jgi:hypothetical protein
MKEANAFQNGREMQAVLKSVSRRLGYDTDISYGMYMLSGYGGGGGEDGRRKLHN